MDLGSRHRMVDKASKSEEADIGGIINNIYVVNMYIAIIHTRWF